MSEIKIDIDNLNSEIKKLKELKKKITTNKKKTTSVVGGGGTISNIEKIGNDYKNMEEKMESLVQNTISFMENVKNSYITSDKNAAKTIK